MSNFINPTKVDIIEQDLTKLSTIRVKSLAKYYCEPANVNDIKKAVEFSSKNNETMRSNSLMFELTPSIRSPNIPLSGKVSFGSKVSL